jgi:methionyl-tRNA formyltransferase
MLKIAFMGTPEFAVAALDSLNHSKHQLVGVVTTPDKPAGRGKQLSTSAVKDYALQYSLPLLQPEKLSNPSFIEQLREWQADVFVVVAFRMLPKSVWTIPAKGTFNIHASLLPQYRGAAPINHAIINGETLSGLTTFIIDEEIDTGRIILQHKVTIGPEDTAGDLHDRLMEISKAIVIKTCDLIDEGEVQLIDQSQFCPSGISLKSAPKIFKEDGHLQYAQTVESAHRLVKGLSPYPTAFVKILNDENEELYLKIFKTSFVKEENKAGKVTTDRKNFLKLGFDDGSLYVHDLQLQNKKRMPIDAFLRGFNSKMDWKWQ